jgi:hypothetical protein
MIEFLFITMLQVAAGEPQASAPAPEAVVGEQDVPESVRERRARHQIRCRDQTVLGSRIGHRVCMSRADEEAMREETQRIADEMHRSGPFGTGSVAGRCAEIGRNC